MSAWSWVRGGIRSVVPILIYPFVLLGLFITCVSNPMNGQKIFNFISILLITGSLFQGGANNCNAALLHPDAPDGGAQLVRERSGQILNKHAPRCYAAGVEIIVSDPIQQFGVGLQDVASGELLSAAKFSFWHYILKQGTNLVGTAVLSHDETGGLKLAG